MTFVEGVAGATTERSEGKARARDGERPGDRERSERNQGRRSRRVRSDDRAKRGKGAGARR